MQNFIKKIAQVNPNSVWLNYQLVGTQWPFETELFTQGGSYQPAILANSILETYKQTTSSCMGCHSKAKFLEGSNANPFGYISDFVFTLNNAQ